MKKQPDDKQQQLPFRKRRFFLYLLALPILQFVMACVKRKVEPLITTATPQPNPISNLQISTLLESQTLLGGDEITLKWEKAPNTYARLEFSANDGQSWQPIPTLPEESSHLWDIPQIQTMQARLRVTDLNSKAAAMSVAFKIMLTFEISLENRTDLSNSGDFQFFSEANLGDFILKRNEDVFVAFNLVCTHLGCNVKKNENALVCPCHGSEFDSNGRVTRGPAETNLKSYKTKWLKDKNKVLVYV